MRTAPVGSESDHRAENGISKCPESLCQRTGLPPSGRREPPPAGTLLPGPSRKLRFRKLRFFANNQSRTYRAVDDCSLLNTSRLDRHLLCPCNQPFKRSTGKGVAKKSGLRRRWTCELVSSQREHGFLRKPDDNKSTRTQLPRHTLVCSEDFAKELNQ